MHDPTITAPNVHQAAARRHFPPERWRTDTLSAPCGRLLRAAPTGTALITPCRQPDRELPSPSPDQRTVLRPPTVDGRFLPLSGDTAAPVGPAAGGPSAAPPLRQLYPGGQGRAAAAERRRPYTGMAAAAETDGSGRRAVSGLDDPAEPREAPVGTSVRPSVRPVVHGGAR